MERESLSQKFPLGSELPAFSLPAADGSTVTSATLPAATGYIVGFICNHCPYVKGSIEALVSLAKQYAPRGITTIAISSNDAVQYPEDSFPKMKELATALKPPFAYLYDESQSVARAFDAACTPEFYLFNRDKRLVYHGGINNSPRDPAKVTEHYLARAVEQLVQGKPVEPHWVRSIGCSIKWK